jgi:hypothetical protein
MATIKHYHILVSQVFIDKGFPEVETEVIGRYVDSPAAPIPKLANATLQYSTEVAKFRKTFETSIFSVNISNESDDMKTTFHMQPLGGREYWVIFQFTTKEIAA